MDVPQAVPAADAERPFLVGGCVNGAAVSTPPPLLPRAPGLRHGAVLGEVRSQGAARCTPEGPPFACPAAARELQVPGPSPRSGRRCFLPASKGRGRVLPHFSVADGGDRLLVRVLAVHTSPW